MADWPAPPPMTMQRIANRIRRILIEGGHIALRKEEIMCIVQTFPEDTRSKEE